MPLNPEAQEGVDIGDAKAVQAAVGSTDNLFDDDSTKPESNWFKFEKVGDYIQGVLVMEPYEVQGDYGPQMIYVIQKPNGDEFNVGLKKLDAKGNLRLNVKQLKSAEVGDEIAFRFEKEIDTGKGFPAKAIDVRIRKFSKNV